MKGITFVSIPSSVIRIIDAAFSCCSAIESFPVASSNPSYKSVNGFLFLNKLSHISVTSHPKYRFGTVTARDEPL